MFKVEIHPLVFKEDFKKIDRPQQQKIIKAVRKKLTLEPERYGKRLSGELSEYWRLRVGDYRVIYRIKKNIVTVTVIKVGIRRDFEVYQDLVNRLRKVL